MAVKVITLKISLGQKYWFPEVWLTALKTPQVGISETSQEAMNVVSEQRKMLEEIKADAARLGQKDATKDDHFLQVVIMFIDSVISVTVGLGQKNTITDNLTVPQLVKHKTVF